MTFQAKRVIPSWTCSTLSNSKMWWVKRFQNLASHGSWCNQLVILVQKAIDAGNFISKTPVFSDVLWDVYFVFWPSILSNASTFLQFRILRCMLFELIILFSSQCFWSTEISSSKSSFVSSKKALLCVSAENIVFPGLKETFKSHFLSESSCLCSLPRA